MRARSNIWLSCVGSASIVVILDVVYSLLTKYAHMPYALFTIAQISFYAAVGWFVASVSRSQIAATIVAASTAIADATLGWTISAAILNENSAESGVAVIVVAAIFTIAFMTGIAALSAFITLRMRARKTPV